MQIEFELMLTERMALSFGDKRCKQGAKEEQWSEGPKKEVPQRVPIAMVIATVAPYSEAHFRGWWQPLAMVATAHSHTNPRASFVTLTTI